MQRAVSAGIAPGSITLSFDTAIGNGSGADFAVFENGFDIPEGTFAELAFVEVSTDGVNFARFPSTSLTPDPVDAFGVIDSTEVFNLAGKHVNNAFTDDTGELSGLSFGTPFDLEGLATDPLVADGLLDLDEINFVRLVDIPGSGDFLDSQGNPIFDPFPTPPGPGGFDLEAIGVINEAVSDDILIGGIGDDSIIVGTDFGSIDATGLGEGDIFLTGAGADTVDFGFIGPVPVGENIVLTGSEGDFLFASFGDILFGGSGDDTLFTENPEGGNRLSGGAGDDSFFVEGSSDRLLGGVGNDIFILAGGDNLIVGNAGEDLFIIATPGEIVSSPNTIADFEAGIDVLEIQGFVANDVTTDGSDILIDGTVVATLLNADADAALAEAIFS